MLKGVRTVSFMNMNIVRAPTPGLQSDEPFLLSPPLEQNVRRACDPLSKAQLPAQFLVPATPAGLARV